VRDLKTMLHDADPWLLPLLAKTWGVSTGKLKGDKLIAALAEAMLNPSTAEKVYTSLDDSQRAALKVLNGYKDRTMSAPMFEMIYQPIRPMGEGKLEREKPYENPNGPAEALYYCGFIGRANDKVGSGIGPVIYIPDDLAQVLPLNRTGYDAAALDNLDLDDEELDALGADDTEDEPVPLNTLEDEDEDDEDDDTEFAPPPTPKRSPRAFDTAPDRAKVPARPTAPTSPAPLEGASEKATPKSATAKMTPGKGDTVKTETAKAASQKAAPAPVSSRAQVEETAFASEVHPVEDVENIRPADTSIVDDLTTLLAFLQLQTPEIEADYLLSDDTLQQRLITHLLVNDVSRLQFMIGVGISAELIEVQSGKLYPRKAEVRRWLTDKRSPQLKWLVDAWLKSEDYREVWHTPGLHAEPGWTYDAVGARAATLDLLHQQVPRQEWWAIDDFIDVVKMVNPNFQRPGGDYESWYIRSDDNEYLHGLNSWDAVEGAVLNFHLVGPMHWLGLMDTAEDAVRFSAYGRAFIEQAAWPMPNEVDEKITVQPDGTFIATRRVSRMDRFQLARFTTWQKPATLSGEPYIYRLDAQGIQRADGQGVTVANIGTFVNRLLEGNPMPPAIGSLLENWRSGAAASVSLERLLVLRATAPETLDALYNEPSLRRYFGARLGPMAAVVREDQLDALRDALGTRGVDVTLD
jgi:hypothetical protein